MFFCSFICLMVHHLHKMLQGIFETDTALQNHISSLSHQKEQDTTQPRLHDWMEIMSKTEWRVSTTDKSL